jgi:hypothetical protein
MRAASAAKPCGRAAGAAPDQPLAFACDQPSIRMTSTRDSTRCRPSQQRQQQQGSLGSSERQEGKLACWQHVERETRRARGGGGGESSGSGGARGLSAGPPPSALLPGVASERAVPGAQERPGWDRGGRARAWRCRRERGASYAACRVQGPPQLARGCATARACREAVRLRERAARPCDCASVARGSATGGE